MISTEELLAAATKVQAFSHSPYSKYPVAVALESESGDIFTGVNVENVSFPCGICAEVNAIGTAVTEGLKKIRQILILTPDPKVANPPCGQCVQVIGEFADPDCAVHLANPGGLQKTLKFQDLAPHFNHQNFVKENQKA